MIPPELKPCPFCGGPGKINESLDLPADIPSHVLVYCAGENCITPTIALATRAEAIAAWNRRASEVQLQTSIVPSK